MVDHNGLYTETQFFTGVYSSEFSSPFNMLFLRKEKISFNRNCRKNVEINIQDIDLYN